MLLSIKDDSSLARKIAKRFVLLLEATGSAYQYQLHDARMNIREIAKRQRSRAKWHDEFIRMEDTNFVAMNSKDLKTNSISTAVFEVGSEERVSEELATTYVLRDNLEEQLHKTNRKRRYKGWELWANATGVVSQAVLSSGAYEQNADYFTFGLLDLMYQMSFRIEEREKCFHEFVGAIKLVLQLSHESANSIHRKAIDLYRRINELGLKDRLTYGDSKEREAIETWIFDHVREVEPPEYSKKYSTLYLLSDFRRSEKITQEISKVKIIGKSLLGYGCSLL